MIRYFVNVTAEDHLPGCQKNNGERIFNGYRRIVYVKWSAVGRFKISGIVLKEIKKKT